MNHDLQTRRLTAYSEGGGDERGWGAGGQIDLREGDTKEKRLACFLEAIPPPPPLIDAFGDLRQRCENTRVFWRELRKSEMRRKNTSMTLGADDDERPPPKSISLALAFFFWVKFSRRSFSLTLMFWGGLGLGLGNTFPIKQNCCWILSVPSLAAVCQRC